MADVDIEIRKVTLDDVDKVLSIRSPEDVYEGYDYLPDLFTLLMKQPTTEGFAAIIDGEFAGFCMATYLDNYKTVVSRAVRVSKTYEGKGVYKTLETFIKDNVRPEIIRHGITFTRDNKYMMKKLTTGAYRMVSKHDLVHLIGNSSTIKSRFKEMNSQTVTETSKTTRIITSTDMKEILGSDEACLRLFPDNEIISDLVPYGLFQSNIQFMFYERSINVGTFDPECISISFGTYYQCIRGFVLMVQVYGDKTIFSNHLHMFVKNMVKYLANEDVHIFVGTKHFSDIENEQTDFALSQYGFVKEFDTEFYSAEMELNACHLSEPEKTSQQNTVKQTTAN